MKPLLDLRTAAQALQFFFLITSLGLVNTSARATELVTLGFEFQAIDLDNGVVIDQLPTDATELSGADIRFAYNADRIPHAVVHLVREGAELAYVTNIGFDSVTVAMVTNLTFSSSPVDMPISATDCIVVRTDQGLIYKLGNAVESDSSVTFNYAQLN
jgi:hypothetical protein